MAFAGTTALITGASSGIGLQVARIIAAAGGGILMPVRNRERGERAVARIRESVPDARITLYDLDLASLASTRAFADELLAAGEPIHHYVVNAGVVTFGDRERHVTADGFEAHWQTNFLGHFALTEGIRPLLSAGRARIAVQTSLEATAGRLAWDDLQGERRYGALRAYRMSKIALGLFAMELARRAEAEGDPLTVNLCHPGVATATGIAPGARAAVPPWFLKLALRMGNRPETAALTAIAALTGDAGRADAPALYVPSRWLGVAGPPRRREPFRNLRNPADSLRLWRVAERMLAAD